MPHSTCHCLRLNLSKELANNLTSLVYFVEMLLCDDSGLGNIFIFFFPFSVNSLAHPETAVGLDPTLGRAEDEDPTGISSLKLYSKAANSVIIRCAMFQHISVSYLFVPSIVNSIA